MPRQRFETFVLAGTTLGDSTAASSATYNGAVIGIGISTGGVGSSGTTGWMGSSTATTSSSGLSSTGFIVFSLEKTGITILQVAPPAAGGGVYWPIAVSQTTGGATLSTGFGYRFPVVDERIIARTSAGWDAAGAANGYCHSIKLILESA